MSDSKANGAMLATERRAIAVLASSVSLRMIGLFMLLPVMAIYARDMQGSTPFLIGMAVGCYGLTQALMQIPLGALSDRIGRKPVIVGGLLLFACGSVLAASTDSIFGLICGRLLQGSGAVAAASSALAADVTRESQRTKAMAIIGVSIGASFMLAIVLGPALATVIPTKGLLLLAAAMGVLAAILVGLCIPEASRNGVSKGITANGSLFKAEFLRIDFAVFVLHAALTAIFVVLPQRFTAYGAEFTAEWMVYLSSLLVSFAVIVPVLWKIDRQRGVKSLYLFASVVLLAGLIALAVSTTLRITWLGLAMFFVGFNILEASMPSHLSKKAPAESRGAVMGVFSTSQFFGTFVGGVGAGVLISAGPAMVFAACGLLVLLWTILVVLAPPRDFQA